jgi:HlyD family secretion protein
LPDPKLLRQIGIEVHAPAGTSAAKEVWVLRENRPVQERLEVGISDGTQSELVRGNVHTGETLITDMAAAPGRRFGLF